jgi:aryl-alcohol dehydrogenase-like predicted oxidoreductase
MSDKDYLIADEVVKVASEVKKTPSQVVLNWTLQKPNAFPLVGVRTVDQLKENLGALDFSLSKDQITRLDEVSKFELGFPHNFIGTSVKSCPWLKDGGVIESDN